VSCLWLFVQFFVRVHGGGKVVVSMHVVVATRSRVGRAHGMKHATVSAQYVSRLQSIMSQSQQLVERTSRAFFLSLVECDPAHPCVCVCVRACVPNALSRSLSLSLCFAFLFVCLFVLLLALALPGCT